MSNMSSVNKDYNSAYANYQNAMQNYKDTANQYTGESGYQKSLEQAAKGANVTAGGIQQQANSAYRSAGLNKAQAANLAAGQAGKGYQDSFDTQQSAAVGQNANAVTSAGNIVNQQSAATQMQQQEGQNKYNRAWGNVGNWSGIASSFLSQISDASTKDAVKIENVKSARELSQDMDKLLCKRSYKTLICGGLKK